MATSDLKTKLSNYVHKSDDWVKAFGQLKRDAEVNHLDLHEHFRLNILQEKPKKAKSKKAVKPPKPVPIPEPEPIPEPAPIIEEIHEWKCPICAAEGIEKKYSEEPYLKAHLTRFHKEGAE